MIANPSRTPPRPQRRHTPLVAVMIGLVATALGPGAAAAHPVRRFFEPTDLGLEDPGVSEFDLQTGLVRSAHSYRVSVPDFEIDVGLTHGLEFDIDGAAAMEDSSGPSFTFNQLNPDNLWTSFKVPVVDVRDFAANWGVGVGAQAGPKLPVARGAAGVGVEGLGLVGFMATATQIALNFGGLVDPASGGHRPSAIEGGIDAQYALDDAGRWSLTAQLGGIRFFTSDPDQLTLSGGVAFDPTDMLEFTVSAFGGPLTAGDRYGILLGVSPKLRLWQPCGGDRLQSE